MCTVTKSSDIEQKGVVKGKTHPRCNLLQMFRCGTRDCIEWIDEVERNQIFLCNIEQFPSIYFIL